MLESYSSKTARLPFACRFRPSLMPAILPVIVDDQVIGGVGVGGGTGDQDAEVAKAGIQSLLDALSDKNR